MNYDRIDFLVRWMLLIRDTQYSVRLDNGRLASGAEAADDALAEINAMRRR